MNRMSFPTNINGSVILACSRSIARRQKPCSRRLRQQFSVRGGQQTQTQDRSTRSNPAVGFDVPVTTAAPPPTGLHVRVSYRTASTSSPSSADAPRKTVAGGRLPSGPGLRDFLVETAGDGIGSDSVGVQGGEMSFPTETWSEEKEELGEVAAKDLNRRSRAVGSNNNGDGKSACCCSIRCITPPEWCNLVSSLDSSPRLQRLQCRNLRCWEALNILSPHAVYLVVQGLPRGGTAPHMLYSTLVGA